MTYNDSGKGRTTRSAPADAAHPARLPEPARRRAAKDAPAADEVVPRNGEPAGGDGRGEAADAGCFTIGPGLRFTYVEATPDSPLFPDRAAAHGQSVWTVFRGALRAPLFAAWKRLGGGESEVRWEGRDAGRALHYAFHTTRRQENPEEFSTRFAAWVPSSVPPLQEKDGDGHEDVLALVPAAAAVAEEAEEATVVAPASDAPPGGDQPDAPEAFFFVSPDLLSVLDAAGRVERVNPAWGRALGHAEEWLTGRLLTDLLHPDDQNLLSRAVAEISPETGAYSVTCRCRRADGAYRWLQFSLAAATVRERTRLYATARDVTESRVSEETIRWQANHDALTDLPNRTLLLDRVAYALAGAHRRRTTAGVLFVDLDRFKRINDTLGHAAGDTLLREVAERLRGALREEDTVARYGGDEFVVLLPHIHGPSDAVAVAEKLLARFERPFHLSGHALPITASIGIAVFPEDGATPEELIQAADKAMYRAKDGGRDRYARSAPGGVVTNPVERLTLESRLSQAIERDELRLHYQPQVCLTTGRMVGVEALMRWQPDQIGHVSPSTFIPLAEETGLIVRIGQWAVQQACRQAMDWTDAGFPLQMAVNLSAAQLLDVRFPDRLAAYLGEVGLSARQVDLELTESTFIRNDASALETLQRLKSLGVRLSVDDFGTGYSSLSYLSRFPIDGVKVDRSFITHIDTNPADEAVVRAIVDLSHTLGLKVIAEGVETPSQRDRLLKMGCDVMQGHLFSAAVAPRELTSLLSRGTALSLPVAPTRPRALSARPGARVLK